MHYRRSAGALVLALVAVLGVAAPAAAYADDPLEVRFGGDAMSPDEEHALRVNLAAEKRAVARWNAAVAYAQAIEFAIAVEEAEAAERRRETRTADRSAPAQPAVQGSGACGGDLPPCAVMRRESGGNLTVWTGGCYLPVGYTGKNPCNDTSTASGKWQFTRSTWDGFAGYVNAADAPEAVQDEHARLTWAGGDGCSHWSACG